ncbi:MAG: hypothetical protein Q8Q28_08950 [Pseudomonadota bacterium]|nr:hypothetical protein [Pseudomonadota bacterium]
MNISAYLKSILGDNYYLEDVLIVGPYPSHHFVDKLINHGLQKLTPTTGPTVTFIIDDGWDIFRVDAIKDAFPSGRGVRQPAPIVRRVAAIDPCGLVHAKIYYFHIRNYENTYTKRYLLLGSANASMGGFGSNSETYMNIDFADINQRDVSGVENYIEQLKAGKPGTKVPNECEFTIARNTSISLPAVRFVNDEASSFDAWLRRGRLCHQYKADQNFGKISLPLKKPLPKGELESALTKYGFGQDQDSKLFSRSYVEVISDTDDERQMPWRGKYFIETNYGYWTSSDCYLELNEEFTTPNKSAREKTLDAIISGTSQESWLSEYEHLLQQFAQQLKPNVVHEFLEHGANGISNNYYLDRARKKLDADKRRANDKFFATRFASGFSFVHVPEMGEDFNEFALNFCETIILRIKGQRVVNKLANLLKEKIDESFLNNPEDLLGYIRNNWSDKDFRRALIDFHKSN